MLESPLTVAVIADSHVSKINDLPSGVLEVLDRADAVIHLGDYTTPEVLKELSRHESFYGVIGNHDNSIGRQNLKVTEIIEIGGKRIGLIHGLFLPMARPKRMLAVFKKHKVDILLCGHNHLITNKTVGKVLLFNPGTVTGQFPATFASFGLLTLNGTIKGEIIAVDPGQLLKKSYLIKLLAVFIRWGIRFLEAWPYLDIRSLLNHFKQSGKTFF
jgi:uncharacterized protein